MDHLTDTFLSVRLSISQIVTDRSAAENKNAKNSEHNQCSLCYYQILIFEDPFHLRSIFHGKTDIEPSASKFGKEYFISRGTLTISGKPGFEIPSSMDSPFAVPYCRFFNFYPFNVSQWHHFFPAGRKIVVLKDNFIFGYCNEMVLVNHLHIKPVHRSYFSAAKDKYTHFALKLRI